MNAFVTDGVFYINKILITGNYLFIQNEQRNYSLYVHFTFMWIAYKSIDIGRATDVFIRRNNLCRSLEKLKAKKMKTSPQWNSAVFIIFATDTRAW